MAGGTEFHKLLLEGIYRFGPSTLFVGMAVERYIQSDSKTLTDPDFRAALLLAALGFVILGLINFIKGVGQPTLDRFRDRLGDGIAAQAERLLLRIGSRFQAEY